MLLGVTFCDVLNFDSHANFVLKLSSQRSCLIKMLRDQALSLTQLNIVFDAFILSRITYAVCARSVFFN
jgi:hypothetical protein